MFTKTELKEFLQEKIAKKDASFFNVSGWKYSFGEKHFDIILNSDVSFLTVFVWEKEINLTIEPIDHVVNMIKNRFRGAWWKEVLIIDLKKSEIVWSYQKSQFDQMEELQSLVPEELKKQWTKLEKAFKEMLFNLDGIERNKK